MRLFTALLPPSSSLDGAGQLAGKAAELRAMDSTGRLRWADRANWHVTLAFYGEVAEERLPGLCERLARAAARGRPLRLRVAGGGHFGHTMLWAGIAGASADGPVGGPAEAHPEEAADASGARRAEALHGADAVEGLRRLAAATAAAGRKAGLDTKDPHRFRAHLTLARSRSSRLDLRPYIAALSAFEGEPWTAGELVLVRSSLPAGGVPGEQPRYEPIASWPLGG